MAHPRTVMAELLPEELAELESRAKRRGLSPNDYLRRALADERFFEDEVRQGGEVLVRLKDGTLKRVKIAQPA